MEIGRREFVFTAAAAALASMGAPAWAAPGRTQPMYGLIGKMLAAPGKRDAVLAILAEGVGEMPGCFSYVVAMDPENEDAIWITEVWDSQASHEASLSLPAVREAITKARPMIAGFGERFVTTPVGGHGLVRPSAS